MGVGSGEYILAEAGQVGAAVDPGNVQLPEPDRAVNQAAGQAAGQLYLGRGQAGGVCAQAHLAVCQTVGIGQDTGLDRRVQNGKGIGKTGEIGFQDSFQLPVIMDVAVIQAGPKHILCGH